MMSRSWRQAVKLMSSEKAHHFRGEEHVQIWIKDYEGKLFFGGLTCMDELFTTPCEIIIIKTLKIIKSIIVIFSCKIYIQL